MSLDVASCVNVNMNNWLPLKAAVAVAVAAHDSDGPHLFCGTSTDVRPHDEFRTIEGRTGRKERNVAANDVLLMSQ